MRSVATAIATVAILMASTARSESPRTVRLDAGATCEIESQVHIAWIMAYVSTLLPEGLTIAESQKLNDGLRIRMGVEDEEAVFRYQAQLTRLMLAVRGGEKFPPATAQPRAMQMGALIAKDDQISYRISNTIQMQLTTCLRIEFGGDLMRANDRKKLGGTNWTELWLITDYGRFSS